MRRTILPKLKRKRSICKDLKKRQRGTPIGQDGTGVGRTPITEGKDRGHPGIEACGGPTIAILGRVPCPIGNFVSYAALGTCSTFK